MKNKLEAIIITFMVIVFILLMVYLVKLWFFS